MSEYTISRSDAKQEHRSLHGGHFAVKRDGVVVALFVFDYPENVTKIYGGASTALAAAKSFMAIDDLVAALKAAHAILPIGRELGLVEKALEKAGIK